MKKVVLALVLAFAALWFLGGRDRAVAEPISDLGTELETRWENLRDDAGRLWRRQTVGREAEAAYRAYAEAIAAQRYGDAKQVSVAAAFDSAHVRELALRGKLAGRSERVHVGHAVEPRLALDEEGRPLAIQVPEFEVIDLEVIGDGTVARVRAIERDPHDRRAKARQFATVMRIGGVWKVSELAPIPLLPDDR